MPPETLRALVEEKAPVIIIDVRDEAQFREETIKGAGTHTLRGLEASSKDISEDRSWCFT